MSANEASGGTAATAAPPTGEGRGRGLRAWLRHAFSMDPFNTPLTEDEEALLARMADFIVARRMTVPAVLLIESTRPLNYVGSQAMAFFEPVVKTVFDGTDYTKLRHILERRPSIERFLELIEARQLAEDQRATSSGPAPDRETPDA